MRALVVYCHPREDSFTAAVRDRVLARLDAAGVEWQISDLYGMGFDPVLAAAEHRAFVGVILGPATAWNRARERWRAGRWRGALRAVRAAWHRSTGL